MNSKKIILVTVAISCVAVLSVSFVHAQTLSFSSSNSTITFGGYSNQTTPISPPPAITTCINQVEHQADTINAELNTSRAISLAQSSGTFVSKLQGYNSKFNSIFDTWSYDSNCNITMKSINVVYSLYNVTGGFVKNVVAQEDPELIQVTNITEQNVPYFTATTSWSGYEMYGNAQQNDPIYKTQAIWNVPTAFDPYSLACLTHPCDLGIWTGLTSGPGGLLSNGTHAIVQTGTDSCVSDNSNGCTSGSFYAWYEFYTTNPNSPGPPVVCNLLNANDQVSVDVINEAINTGGDPTKYDIHNVDSTSSTMCTPIVGHKFVTGSLPYYDQYINESLFPEVIPKFGSDTMTGYMFDQAKGFQSMSIPYNNGFYNSYTLNDINGVQSGQNINFGGAGSGSFISFWSPTCSPPGTGISWTIQTSCTLVSNYQVGANIEITGGPILTIASGTTLNIDLTQNHIKIDNNGGLLIEGGGKISKN